MLDAAHLSVNIDGVPATFTVDGEGPGSTEVSVTVPDAEGVIYVADPLETGLLTILLDIGQVTGEGQITQYTSAAAVRPTTLNNEFGNIFTVLTPVTGTGGTVDEVADARDGEADLEARLDRDFSDLEGQISSNDSGIAALDGRVTVNEGDIYDLQQVMGVPEALPSAGTLGNVLRDNGTLWQTGQTLGDPAATTQLLVYATLIESATTLRLESDTNTVVTALTGNVGISADTFVSVVSDSGDLNLQSLQAAVDINAQTGIMLDTVAGNIDITSAVGTAKLQSDLNSTLKAISGNVGVSAGTFITVAADNGDLNLKSLQALVDINAQTGVTIDTVAGEIAMGAPAGNITMAPLDEVRVISSLDTNDYIELAASNTSLSMKIAFHDDAYTVDPRITADRGVPDELHIASGDLSAIHLEAQTAIELNAPNVETKSAGQTWVIDGLDDSYIGGGTALSPNEGVQMLDSAQALGLNARSFVNVYAGGEEFQFWSSGGFVVPLTTIDPQTMPSTATLPVGSIFWTSVDAAGSKTPGLFIRNGVGATDSVQIVGT